MYSAEYTHFLDVAYRFSVPCPLLILNKDEHAIQKEIS